MIIFRFKTFALFVAAIALQGCAPRAELSCDNFGEVVGITPNDEMLIFPAAILEEAQRLEEKIEKDPSLAGFSGLMSANLAGSKAYSFRSDLEHLRGLIAYQVSLEQANDNEGIPLVDLRDEGSCEMLANSVASLDQGLSSESLREDLSKVQKRFGPDYPYRLEQFAE